jgi:hypothetical protein
MTRRDGLQRPEGAVPTAGKVAAGGVSTDRKTEQTPQMERYTAGEVTRCRACGFEKEV